MGRKYELEKTTENVWYFDLCDNYMSVFTCQISLSCMLIIVHFVCTSIKKENLKKHAYHYKAPSIKKGKEQKRNKGTTKQSDSNFWNGNIKSYSSIIASNVNRLNYPI